MEEANAAYKAARAQGEALLKAASRGMLEEVQALVAAGADVAFVDEARAGPLHLAAARGHAAVIDFLATHGADVDADDAKGRTALHVACLAGQQAAALALLARGCVAGGTDGEDGSPLGAAAAAGRGELVRALLKAGAPAGVRDRSGLTPLARAVANDAAEATEALLGVPGLEPTGDTPNGLSLLHLACATGALRCARLLLRAGLSPRDAANPGALAPAHAAAAAGHPALLELLLGWRKGTAEAMAVNALTADGQTPLDCLDSLPPDAAEDAAACRALLLPAGAKRAAALPPPAPPAPPPQRTPSEAAVIAFAGLPPAKRLRQLADWAVSGSGPAVVAPQLAQHARLRSEGELEEIIAGLLENEEWQELMATPAVRRAVEEVQADPRAIGQWGEVPECLSALTELRKLQAFCKPRGLRTALPALLAGPGNSGALRRARAAALRAEAHDVLDAAQSTLLFAAGVDEPAAALPQQQPQTQLADAQVAGVSEARAPRMSSRHLWRLLALQVGGPLLITLLALLVRHLHARGFISLPAPPEEPEL